MASNGLRDLEITFHDQKAVPDCLKIILERWDCFENLKF